MWTALRPEERGIDQSRPGSIQLHNEWRLVRRRIGRRHDRVLQREVGRDRVSRNVGVSAAINADGSYRRAAQEESSVIPLNLKE